MSRAPEAIGWAVTTTAGEQSRTQHAALASHGSDVVIAVGTGPAAEAKAAEVAVDGPG